MKTTSDGLTLYQVGLLDKLDGHESLEGVLLVAEDDGATEYAAGYGIAMQLEQDVLDAGYVPHTLLELNCYLDFCRLQEEKLE